MTKDLLRLNVRIDEDLRKIVDQGRTELGLSSDSEFIRWLIRRYSDRTTMRLTDEQAMALLDLLNERLK